MGTGYVDFKVRIGQVVMSNVMELGDDELQKFNECSEEVRQLWIKEYLKGIMSIDGVEIR